MAAPHTPASGEQRRAHQDGPTRIGGVETPSLGTITSAHEALAQGAFNRLRIYRITMIAWCAVGCVASVFIPGTMQDRITCWISVCVYLASYAFRKGATHASTGILQTFPVALVQVLGALGIALGLGLSSSFIALFSIGLVLYYLSAPSNHAKRIFVLVVSAYAFLSILVLSNVLSGTGLLIPTPLPFGTRLANAVWVEATFVTAYIVGRLAGRDSARLVAQLEYVVRNAARREALLMEARDELARAAAVGVRGPFTDIDLGGYHLGSVIGRGGMGEVYAARTHEGAPECAVKLLRRDVLAQPEIVRRFEREARIVASLDSPHIVKVYDVGGAEAPLPFIAMERLRGEDLIALLRERTMLTLDEVTTLVRDIARGLHVAHEAGVVHRDLKPGNLFHARCEDGVERWKILDFGISKLLHTDEGNLTASQILGTPQYMSPEQAAGRRGIDGRADLYSLALIAYRALTGHLAFPRGDMGEVLHAVLTEMPQDPRVHRTLPDDVALVLRIALSKKPDERFANSIEMAEAFEAAAVDRLSPAWREHAEALLHDQAWGEGNGASGARLSH